MKRWLLPLVVSMAAGAPAQKPTKDAPLPLPMRLTSDGHACAGYFKLTQSLLVWKSSFSTCRASWTGVKQGDGWVLTLGKDAAQSKGCTYKVVEIHHSEGMDPKLGIWSVAGYAKVNHSLHDLVLGCSWMQTD